MTQATHHVMLTLILKHIFLTFLTHKAVSEVGAATYNLYWLNQSKVNLSFTAGSLPGQVPGLSWPSCPQLLEPHVYTLPSCSRNIECCPPHATSISPLALNTWQLLGSNMGFLSMPIPNCPSFALPQHSMLARDTSWAAIWRGRDSNVQTEEDRSVQSWEQPRFLLFM